MSGASAELDALVAEAAKLAVACFAAGESNPFLIFVNGTGQTHLVDVTSVSGDITPGLVEDARRVVSEGVGRDALRYAIAFDGYLTRDGERTDTAFVEAGERGGEVAYVVAQRYRAKKRSKGAEKIGPVLLVGQAELLLR